MSINFLDLETTDLDPRKGQIWEVGVIRRRHGVDTEFLWQFAVDLDRANEKSLAVGQFHDRFVVPESWEAARLDPASGQVQQRLTLAEALCDFQRLWEWEDERPVTHMVGAVPSFDDGYLRVLFAAQQKCVCWHYHLVCAENLAAGCLGLEPPWDSEDLSRAMGVDPGRYLRHSAIGDSRLARDLYDAVMARKMSGPIPSDRPYPDTNPDHVLSIPTSEHTVTVPGYGDAVVAEVAGAWNWHCNRHGCGIGAICILTVEQAESSARWHLEHEHDPLGVEPQQEVDDRLEANGLPAITEPGRGSASISRTKAGWAWSCDGWPDCAGLVATSYPSYASAAHTARSHLRSHRLVHTAPQETTQ